MTLDVFTLERRDMFKKLVVEYFNHRTDEEFAKEVMFIIKMFK